MERLPHFFEEKMMYRLFGFLSFLLVLVVSNVGHAQDFSDTRATLDAYGVQGHPNAFIHVALATQDFLPQNQCEEWVNMWYPLNSLCYRLRVGTVIYAVERSDGISSWTHFYRSVEAATADYRLALARNAAFPDDQFRIRTFKVVVNR